MKPWEKYQQQEAPAGAPWEKYQQAPPSAPPTRLGLDPFSGFNRGLAQSLDLVASPVTQGLQAIGVPVSDAPMEGIFQRLGLTHDPVTPAGAVLQGVGGAVGGAALPGAVPLGLARTGVGLAAPAVRAAASSPLAFAGAEGAGALLSGVGAEVGRSAGGEGGALLGGLAGGLLAPTAAAGARGGMRGGARGADALTANRAAFEAAGVTPTAGQASQSPVMMGLEKALAVTPGGYIARRPILADQTQQGFERVRRLLSDLDAAPSETVAGQVVERGLKSFRDEFQAKAGELYLKADDLIPETTTGKLTRFRAVTDAIQGSAPETAKLRAALGSDRMTAIAKGLEDTPADVPYEAMRQLRTQLGDALSGGGMVADAPRGQLKRLYGALSDDMKEALADQPTALRAQRRADRYYRAGLGRIEEAVEPLMGNDRKTVEGVFRSLEGLYKSPSALGRVKRSMKPEAWNRVAGLAIDKLGAATPGAQSADGDVFSFARFLTNWNRMPDGAKRHLFGTAHKRDLDAIAKTAELIKNEGAFLANPSGTGALSTAGALLVSPFTAVGSAPLIAGTLGSYGATKLLNSRPFMSWLAESTRVPIAQMPGHVERLDKVVETMGAQERDAVREYIDWLNQPRGQGA